MNLIALKQIRENELSGYIAIVSSGVNTQLQTGISGALYAQMAGISGVLRAAINNVSGGTGTSTVTGLVSLNFRLVSGTDSSGFSFGQTLATVPNVVPHVWTTGAGDQILGYLTSQSVTGCYLAYSDTIPDNFYFANIIAKT